MNLKFLTHELTLMTLSMSPCIPPNASVALSQVRCLCYPVSVAVSLSGYLCSLSLPLRLCQGASITVVFVARSSVTPSPSSCLCCRRLCYPVIVSLSLSRAPLSRHHRNPVSITGVSVTPSLSLSLCRGALL